ncbi:bifunctional methylenetetrahydrofolate dehydrogenase/methenyltetrahydrofolate cyclohydrolase FolD [Legionella dresdenensis]|uniref:Bifunctional protein FolD n=1 Tax=Legionella dresdenensis TaxID=450200 RepID=A0ABV8CHB5_9GAMM
MTALLLDGKQVAQKLQAGIRTAVTARLQTGYRAPGLAVVLVGNDPASEIYVKNKRKACEAVGIHSYAYDLPSSTTEQQLLQLINELNQSTSIDGILVQLPLPDAVDSSKIIEAIHPGKDVDGFHPYNIGLLAQRIPKLRPCTPYGIIQLLAAYDISMKSKNAVVVGASNIVGRPMALEFLNSGATVTVCHRKTPDLEPHIRMADILVVATGVPDSVKAEWLQSHQIVIDVGIHRMSNGKLRGDIDFEQALQRVKAITPVPGGVGPMTIACLLQNTLQAAQWAG